MNKYILVSGFDYELKGLNFFILSGRRMNEIIKANPDTDIKLIFVDFASGKIIEKEIKYVSGKKTEIDTTTKTADPVSSKNYVSGKFKNGQRNTLSITHLYDLISDIGKNDPNTLKELSIFSHSWMGGAIMVNSYDDRSTTYTGAPGTQPPAAMIDIVDPKKRDPDDKDGRTIDFSSPTMDVSTFKKAFSSDAFSWIWGCTATEIFKDMIYGIRKNKNYTGKSTPDTATFQIWRKVEHEQYNSYLGIALPAGNKPMTVTFAQIKKLFCMVLKNTYAFDLATASDKKVYATFVGVGADMEPNGLMKANPQRMKVINFYKDHLKIVVDPTGRNYGEYLPTLTCPVP